MSSSHPQRNEGARYPRFNGLLLPVHSQFSQRLGSVPCEVEGAVLGSPVRARHFAARRERFCIRSSRSPKAFLTRIRERCRFVQVMLLKLSKTPTSARALLCLDERYSPKVMPRSADHAPTVTRRASSSTSSAKPFGQIAFVGSQGPLIQSLVGVAGFEPATTRTPSECATSLRHTPTRRRLYFKPDQNTHAQRADHSFFLAATRGRHCTNDRIST